MADTVNYKPHQRITAKDIANLMLVSNSSAKRYLADIKSTLNLTTVCYKHYTEYFKLC